MNKGELKSIFVVHTNGGDEWIRVPKKTYDRFIDQIYDAYEAELEAKDKRIDTQSSVIIACQNTIVQKDGRIAELETERDELEYKFAGYLDHTTNSRISKTYGELPDMIKVFDDGNATCIAELEAKQEAIKEYCRERIQPERDGEYYRDGYENGRSEAYQDILTKMEQEQ